MAELFLDTDNTKRNFLKLINNIPNTVKNISASIAYNSCPNLLDQCIKKMINLEWWGLFNEEMSTDVKLIEKALSSTYITFYSITNNFHSKLIYFHDYGLYIGSHNMTEKAFKQNIECGVFFYENEITEKQHKQLKEYFSFLRNNSKKFIKEDQIKIKLYSEKISGIDDETTSLKNKKKNIFLSSFPELKSFVPKILLKYEKKIEISEEEKRFSQEWRNAHQILDKIEAALFINPLPDFVKSNASRSSILDQVLYLYYETNTKHKGNNTKELIEEMFLKNRNRHNEAIQEAIDLWNKRMPNNGCLIRINDWGFKNLELLEILKSRDLTKEEFKILFSQNNVLIQYSSRFPNEELGKPKELSMTVEEKIPLICDYFYIQKSQENLPIQDVLRYLLFDDSVETETRVYNLINNPKYKIHRLSKSMIGELLGWGRPDITHLRNDSTNRALRCLGFDIEIE